jgi:DNA uptake protein ComE-like DNA-binding protein
MSKLTIKWDDETYEDVVSSTAPKSIREVKLAAIDFLDKTEAKLNLANDKYTADRAALAIEDDRKDTVKEFDAKLKTETADLKKKADDEAAAKAKADADTAAAAKKAADEAAKTAGTDFAGGTPSKSGPLPDDFPGVTQLRAADINTYAQARKAGLAEGGFESIPNIGPATAQKIVEALK